MSQLVKVRPEVHTEPIGVDFEQTVPRSLVHRRAVSEVFLTDLLPVDDSTVEVGAQWPRDHSFYRLRSGQFHDPLLLAESIRQAGLAIAHRVFGVPMDWQFLTRRQDYQISTAGLARESQPVDLLLGVACRDVKRTRRGVSGMSMDMVVYRDCERVGTGFVDWSCVSPASYARLRSATAAAGVTGPLPRPVAPGLVGRDREHDVVLTPGPTRDTWQLRVDQEHAVLFDHFVDHVPGMVLMEAARQATILHCGGTEVIPVRSQFTFDRYVELDEPATVTVSSLAGGADARTVRADFVQGGRIMATGLLDVLTGG
ncbi:ScbA/BarX family gamma-butyrolactone biosynthesis protein [Couchioplanes azureus]|uniref:ScbA/BarX family gamma-butyrolactone biosynthesis protein n=1 Tax=Couchioplanes caeruleus TaxID=56438 RepID=UPI0016714F5B|nr:ScbA/BarX family gamma-butyrolactone biosynthesis protein [Couchioplanes caeruleus]GGQ76141.1 adhesin [Couchioplanes caeruleus subsp. azureus]